MKRVTIQLAAIALMMAATIPAWAQNPNSFSSRRGVREVTVLYRLNRARTRDFSTRTEAFRFASRLRRLGYVTRLRRIGRQYQVEYRQTRFRSRIFRGRNALREALSFRGRLRRLGYETRIRTRTTPPIGVPNPGNFNPRQLVGLSESSATRLAQRNGFRVRVVARDGRNFPVTRDFRRDRVNLSIVRGRVIRATIG